MSLLNDKDSATRMAAVHALGTMRHERAVQALTDLVQYYGRGSGANPDGSVSTGLNGLGLERANWAAGLTVRSL